MKFKACMLALLLPLSGLAQKENEEGERLFSLKINALLEEKKPTGEGLQQALYLKSMITYRTDKDAAKVILLEARAAAPTSKMATGQIDRVLQQVFKVEPKK